MAKCNISNPGLEPGAVVDAVRAAMAGFSLAGGGRRLGVAVSGGADSVCLLHVLTLLSDELGLPLEVLHLNHGLRGEASDGDERFTADLAARLRWPFLSARVDLEPGAGLERRAREARLEFYRRAMADRELERVATAHTLDDQAETVLLRLLRGAAPEALRSILLQTREGLIRPMLSVSRNQVHAWLAGRGIRWREDETNEQENFRRNWIRHSVLPMLEGRYPGVRATLARHAALAAQDAEYWREEVRRTMEEFFTPAGEALEADVEKLATMAPALLGRVIRRAVEQVRPAAAGLEGVHVRAVLGLVRGARASGRVGWAGVEIWRSMGRLRVGRRVERVGREEVPVLGPGEYELAGAGVRVRVLKMKNGLEAAAGVGVEKRTRTAAQDGSGSAAMVLRVWRPGDRAAWTDPPRRLKEMFQEKRIPAWERVYWPVLAAGSMVYWALGMGSSPAAEAEVEGGTGGNGGDSPI